MRDPDHWLYRLEPAEWLRAAENELLRAEQSLKSRQQRPGVAGARRAAGMAWNAVMALAPEPDEKYGRSYMDHLNALVNHPVLGADARALVEAPMVQQLVPLRPDLHLVEHARAVLEHARQLIS